VITFGRALTPRFATFCHASHRRMCHVTRVGQRGEYTSAQARVDADSERPTEFKRREQWKRKALIMTTT